MENNQNRKVAFIPLFLSLCIIFLSIGYASGNSITDEIKGTLVASKQDGVFITDVVYDSSMNANNLNSKINNYHKTTLNSSIVLSNSSDSAITYRVTVYNSTDNNYKFNDVLYGEDFYDNNSIVFELTNLEKGDEIIGKGYITFYITFSYLNDIVSSNNILNSYLNFEFIKMVSQNENLELKYDIANSWNNNGLYYYQVNFTLTNIGSIDVDNWTIDIPFIGGYEYIGGWSSSNYVNFDSSQDNNLNIYSDYLLSSGNNIGFTIQIAVEDGNFDFDEFVINGTEINNGNDDNNSDSGNENNGNSNSGTSTIITTEGIEVKLEKSNGWTSGNGEFYYQYGLTVTNTTSSVINDWQVVLSVPTGSKITQAWNIDYENGNGLITIKSPSNNGSLAVNSSYTQGGFIIMLTNDGFQVVAE